MVPRVLAYDVTHGNNSQRNGLKANNRLRQVRRHGPLGHTRAAVAGSDKFGVILSSVLSHAIYAEGETSDQLRVNVRDSVRCYFDTAPPTLIRLYYVKDEVLAA